MFYLLACRLSFLVNVFLCKQKRGRERTEDNQYDPSRFEITIMAGGTRSTSEAVAGASAIVGAEYELLDPGFLDREEEVALLIVTAPDEAATAAAAGTNKRKIDDEEEEETRAASTKILKAAVAGTNKRKIDEEEEEKARAACTKQKSPRRHPPPLPLSSPSSSMLLAQPRPCLVQCLSYLDSESIRQVCLLSKEYHDIIHNDPGMANTWTKALEIRPSSSSEDDNTNDDGRLDRLVKQLYHRQLYYRPDQLQMIQEIRIIDPHKFKYSTGGVWKIMDMMDKFQLGGTVSLRMVSSSTSILPKGSFINDMFHALVRILPLQNLRVVDLSNCIFHSGSTTRVFWENCFSLEQFTFNNNHHVNSALNITGTELNNCSSLTEITMDDSMFVGYTDDGLSDIENDEHSHKVIFWKCSSKVLRNVSIKNATYDRNEGVRSSPAWRQPPTVIPVIVPLPQKALIKFIRNGPPSLRYFRSDLTPANMDMLRLERPDIVFS